MAGLRRAKLEGKHIGRPRLEIDREAVLEERAQGMSLNELARKYQVSKATIHKLLKEGSERGGQEPLSQALPQAVDCARPNSAISAG